MPNVLDPRFPPSVFVGLGGAGTETVARIKRRLEQCARAGLPVNLDKMAYACFDIESLDQHSQIAREELRAGESFITTSGFVPSDYIGRYYDSTDIKLWWDAGMNDVCRHIEYFDAARTHRQLGRLALFAHQDTVRSKLIDCVNRAAEASKGKGGKGADKQAPPQIYIVSGTCGGTGSGAFLDANLMAFEETKRAFANTPRLTAMVVLPDFYIAVDSSNAQVFNANAFAFFEELEYFQKYPEAFRKSCMCPRRYKANGGAQFPADWHPGRPIVVLDQHVSSDDSISDPSDFHDYLGQIAFHHYLVGVWETSNQGFQNLHQLVSRERDGRKTYFSTAGLRRKAYPADIVRDYIISRYIVRLLDFAQNSSEAGKKNSQERLDESGENLKRKFDETENQVKSNSTKRVVVPPEDRNNDVQRTQQALSAAWSAVKGFVERDAEQQGIDAHNTLEDIKDETDAVLAQVMNECSWGYRFTDDILDACTEDMRLTLQRYRQARDQAESSWQTSLAYLEGSGESGSVLNRIPRNGRQAAQQLQAIRGHIASYYRNRMLSAGYAALYDKMSLLVGETKQARNNILGQHDEYRNKTWGQIQNRLKFWQKNDAQQSDLEHIKNDRTTTYCPEFPVLTSLQRDLRVTTIVSAAKLDDVAAVEGHWRAVVTAWADDGDAAIRLSDVDSPEAVAEELERRVKVYAEAQMDTEAQKLPGIREALRQSGESLPAEIKNLKTNTYLTCRASHAEAEMGESKSVLLIDSLETKEAAGVDKAMKEVGLEPVYVRTIPDAFVTLTLCHGFPATSLRKHDEWMSAFASVVTDPEAVPHLDKCWNKPGGLAKVLNTPWYQFDRRRGETAKTSFIKGRFVQWVLESAPTGGKNGAVDPQMVEVTRDLFKMGRRQRRSGESGAVSWVQRLTTASDIWQAGYYAILLDGGDETGFEAVEWNPIGLSLCEAAETFRSQTYQRIVDRAETFMETVIDKVGGDLLQTAADAFVDELKKQRDNAETAHQDRDCLGVLIDLFEGWTDGLVEESIPGPGRKRIPRVVHHTGVA